MLKQFKELVDGLDKKDENSALQVINELSKIHKEIELDKTYWVSQWSWTPIVDGIFSYEQHLRVKRGVGEITAYYTGTNYRVYFPWDIYETKEECNEACSLKNSFAYDWDMAMSKFIRKYNLDVRP